MQTHAAPTWKGTWHRHNSTFRGHCSNPLHTAASDGIGERVLTVKGDVFTVKDRNVYLTLNPADVAALPEALPFDDAASMLPRLHHLH
jgi:hypothetical protein